MSSHLQSLVSAFRMSELQALLAFAGKSKAGKKSELQARAMKLVNKNLSDVNMKIQELSNSMYRSGGSGASTSSSSYSNPIHRDSGGSGPQSRLQTSLPDLP